MKANDSEQEDFFRYHGVVDFNRSGNFETKTV